MSDRVIPLHQKERNSGSRIPYPQAHSEDGKNHKPRGQETQKTPAPSSSSTPQTAPRLERQNPSYHTHTSTATPTVGAELRAKMQDTPEASIEPADSKPEHTPTLHEVWPRMSRLIEALEARALREALDEAPKPALPDYSAAIGLIDDSRTTYTTTHPATTFNTTVNRSTSTSTSTHPHVNEHHHNPKESASTLYLPHGNQSANPDTHIPRSDDPQHPAARDTRSLSRCFWQNDRQNLCRRGRQLANSKTSSPVPYTTYKTS